jgi:NADPH2:quinone reductase
MPRAVICRTHGSFESLALETVPSPPLADSQVRVALQAAGLNFPDVLMVRGTYQHKPPLPFVPGMEAAGIVSEIGPKAVGFAVGDRVMVGLMPGGYADEAVVSPDHLTRLPDHYSFEEGAVFRVGYTTAYHALIERSALVAGETLLVHGAGGGMGLAAVELGKVLGATVIAAASSDDKLAAARQKGADHTVRYSDGPFPEAVKGLTGGKGADVVYDPVGGEVLEQSLRCIAFGARILVIGFTGGVGLPKTNLLLIKGATLMGTRAGEAARRNPKLAAARRDGMARLLADGKLRPHISARFPLERFADGMRLLEDRKAVGRIVLTTR